MKQILLSKTSNRPDKHYALVDNKDFEWLDKLNWTYGFNKKDGREFAFRKEWPSNRTIMMSRLIMNEPKGLEVDHINRNPLDNRRKNLRLSDRSQNAFNKNIQANNTSGYRGVYKYTYNRKKPWFARIKFQGKNIYVGYYATPQEASKAYKKKALELFGEFAESSGYSLA